MGSVVFFFGGISELGCQVKPRCLVTDSGEF